VVVTHKQHCFFVHTPPSQGSPVLSGFAVQGFPPQEKPPHVKGGVVGAGVVVAQRQHRLLSQTLPMQTKGCNVGRGSHGVLHFHDEQYVGGVVVGAGVVVRHSQHCLSEQTFATPLSLQISVAAMFLGVQTPLHTHDAQSVGWVVVVLWKQHCSMVHVPAVQTMSLKDASRETQGSPGQLMEAHVAGGFGVVVITMSQQTLRVQPPTGQTVFGMGAPFAFHPGEHVYRGDAQVGTGTTGGFGVVVVHTQQKTFLHPVVGHILSWGNATSWIPKLVPHWNPAQV
jgi:hypothetical protein